MRFSLAVSFPVLDADADVSRVSVLESLCMHCHEQGLTRMLLTRIPYFRSIVLMSFECPHCHARHAEVQPANELADKGARTTLSVDPANPVATRVDLNRQVIKSESCRLLIPELDFEIPANQRRGEINTVEGVLTNVAESLQADQPSRARVDPQLFSKIQAIITQFRAFAGGHESFTFILDDPAGNSFLENPSAPHADPRVSTSFYERTRAQTEELGYVVQENQAQIERLPVIHGEEAASKLQRLIHQQNGAASAVSSSSSSVAAAGSVDSGVPSEITAGKGVSVSARSLPHLDSYFNVSDRSAVLLGPCASCHSADCETRLCVTEVPHFHDVALLVTNCERCGYRDAEVKPMGQVSALGRRVTVRVTSPADLARDILKSHTASVLIPDLELEMQAGTLGAKYTTLEGLIEDIRAQLTTHNAFAIGDSSGAEAKGAMRSFLEKLGALLRVSEPWTFVLDDPLGSSLIFSPLGESDPNLTVERYERSFEQNEALGLNDINVEHYHTPQQAKEMAEEMEREARDRANEAQRDGASGVGTTAEQAHHEATRVSRLAQLKAGKIGGNIPVGVDPDEDDQSASSAAPKL